MSYEGSQPVKLTDAVAGADLSAASVQYKFVKRSTTNTGRVILCSATTDKPCGVLQSPAPTSALDQPVEVVSIGQTKLQSDSTVQVGNDIMTDANGRATPALATGRLVGTAGADAASASAAGDYFSAYVNCATPSIKA